jgi:hypothetical protein
MNTKQSFERILSLTTLFVVAPMSSGCDADELEVDELEIDEVEVDDEDMEMRSGSAPMSTKWRIRNAAAQGDSGQWVFREIDFCADAACNQPLAGGTAIDSGASEAWSLPSYAFDNDTTTFWKTFDTDVAGQSWIGLDFGVPTGVQGVRLQTDNAVYSVDSIYVEYFDASTSSWVVADYLGNVPSFTTVTYDVMLRERFPTQWRVRNGAVQEDSGQIVLREMDFCADPACATPFSGGTAIDSGASEAWSLPAYAFDGDTTTFWKTFDADVAGQSYLGMDFGEITEVKGIFLQTDNVVYSVDSMYVEYYDIVDQEWVTADYLGNLPAASNVTRVVKMRDSFPTQWRVRNAVAQTNSGQIVLREMDFCADTACATPLTGGTAFDSGASQAWSLPANAFDNNTTTMWKTFDAGVAGQSFIGMDFGQITEAHGVYLKTDNVVYSVSAMHVEYYDVVEQAWITSDYLGNLPANANVVRGILGAP